MVTFEGDLTAVRMDDVSAARMPGRPRGGAGRSAWPALTAAWRTSLDHTAYVEGVAEIRRRIAAGTVYQVNLCRVLEHDLPEGRGCRDLGSRLAPGNPAPYAATIDLPEAGLEIACASPEAYLVRRGDRVTSRPIKGTAPTAAELLPKDYAENVMIVDLVRHDLQHVCLPGTVEVDHLCRVEQHPGLVHLVSDVSGHPARRHDVARPARRELPARLGVRRPQAHRAAGHRRPRAGAARPVLRRRRLGRRRPRRGRLAVGIRTFWAARDDAGRRVLRFGTGAGITWGSDAEGEWGETELKAARLVALATGGGPGMRGCDA